MPLAPVKISKIRSNTVINPQIAEKLIEDWESFSDAKKLVLSQLLDLAYEAHSFLLERAAKNYSGFSADISNFITHRIHSALESEETEERANEADVLEDVMHNL